MLIAPWSTPTLEHRTCAEDRLVVAEIGDGLMAPQAGDGEAERGRLVVDASAFAVVVHDRKKELGVGEVLLGRRSVPAARLGVRRVRVEMLVAISLLASTAVAFVGPILGGRGTSWQ
jgi:hypothetical protein